MATTVAGVVLGMQLLEPGFRTADRRAQVIGRVRTAGDPEIEAAVDAALAASGLEVVTVDWDGFEAAGQAFMSIFFSEIWHTDRRLLETDPDGIGGDVAQAMALAEGLAAGGTEDARLVQEAARTSLAQLFGQAELLVLPTLPVVPPRLDAMTPESLFDVCIEVTKHVAPFNVTGNPCTAQPVPMPGHPIPASLQLVAPAGGEELLLATAAHIEEALQH
jgi:amidase